MRIGREGKNMSHGGNIAYGTLYLDLICRAFYGICLFNIVD